MELAGLLASPRPRLLTFLAALAAFREPLLRRLTRRGLAPRDRELFGRLLRVLPAEGSIAFIGNADFGNAFDGRRFDDLNNFYYSWDNPEHRFVDRALEEKRMELFVAVVQFLDAVGLHAAFLEGADFGRAFDGRRLDDLNHFYHSWDDPEHRFLDQALEQKRMELFVAVVQFLDAVRLHADPDADLPGRSREGLRQLNGAAKAVVTIHQEIVRLGRPQAP